MGTSDVLRSSVHNTHTRLAERLEEARSMQAPPGEPRHSQEKIDAFLASASKHLHAVDAALAPVARRRVDGQDGLVHDYLHAVRELEVVLAHVKAHEYGSVYETSFSWDAVWSDVDAAMGEQRRREVLLTERLSEALDDGELEELARQLHEAEESAPTRPHPYTPHTGLLGLVARKVMHAADRCWDTLENRMVPEPKPEPKKPPGRLAQYFLADPRFEEEEPLEEERLEAERRSSRS